MDAIPPNDEEHKSLFSIRVDDVIIQRIFKNLEDQVIKLSSEVKVLTDELRTRPTREEVDILKEKVADLQDGNAMFTEKINTNIDSFTDNFSSNLKETKTYVHDQISHAIFSVNNVVRAQNSLIEEKVYEISRPSLEFTAMQADIRKLQAENKELKDQMAVMNRFFADFLGSSEGGKKITLMDVITNATAKDRERIKVVEKSMLATEDKLKKFELQVKKVIGPSDFKMPSFATVPKYIFSEKPKLPKIEIPKYYTDYFTYLMELAPSLQKVLSTFYHQICSLANTVYDKVEKENEISNIDESLLKMQELAEELRGMKTSFATTESLDYIDSEINKIKNKGIKRPEFNELVDDVHNLENQFIHRDELDKIIVEVRSKLEDSIAEAVSEATAQVMSNQKHTIQSDSLPAITCVTPRGTSSNRMIFKGSGGGGASRDVARPSTSRVTVRKKELLEEEIGKESRRVRPATKIQFQPDDVIPNGTTRRPY